MRFGRTSCGHDCRLFGGQLSRGGRARTTAGRVRSFVLGLIGLALGLGYLINARRYDGVGRLRRIGEDGTASIRTAGHKLLPGK
ncbi:hypothetical protein ABT224_35215 [Streptomyces sp. NPDC001584]|uniref:hypothetical protein n=1 Tax=Streptomyces sp. NPDC001584 TaxID=3154521 RepID=UPI003332BAD0